MADERESGSVRAAASGRVADVAAANNFDALRLMFAGLVVAYHLALLPGIASWRPAAEALALGAEIGVQGFFVLSGYLVYGSLKRSRTVWVYAEKRVRRLYPAYAVVVLVCAGAALAFSPEARSDLDGVARYIGANLVFLNFLAPSLPGVFADHPAPAVNGALWTIKVEVLFYALLPAVAGLLGRGPILRWIVIAALYVLAEFWRVGLTVAAERASDPILASLAIQLPGQLSFFLVGVAAHFVPVRLFRRVSLALLAVTLLVGSAVFPWLEPARAVSLGWFSLVLALGAPRLIDAARFGDLSYGVYITHFPIIQTLIAVGAFAVSPGWAAGLAVAIILVAALCLWWLVERRALRADSAYRRA